MTFAIWGPFARSNAGRQRRIATATPLAMIASTLSAELADAADRFGKSHLEAAVFDRLGADLLA